MIESNKATLKEISAIYEKNVENKKKELQEGYYINNIIKIISNQWRALNKKYHWYSLGAIFIGLIIVFFNYLNNSSLQNDGYIITLRDTPADYIGYGIGLITSILGCLIFENTAKALKEKSNILMYSVDKQGKYSSKKISELCSISEDLAAIIRANEKNKVTEVNEYILQQKKIESTKKDDEIKRQNTELKYLESKHQENFDKIKEDTTINIADLKKELCILHNNLNKNPGTFDNEFLNWESEHVLKGKENVASIVRIAKQEIKINIESIQHTINIPKCIPFLNKTNLVFNCDSAIETSEAIRVTHNIIGRTLLSLPASKTKITFIDPIYYNPVSAGLCSVPEEYYYSSAKFYSDGIDTFRMLTHYTGN